MYFASASAVIILASSAGWNLSGPISIQDIEPLVLCARKGVMSSTTIQKAYMR